MKLKVIVDNNTYIDQYYCGEPALCFYIEDEDAKILLDTGYSNVFIENAKKLSIDLSNLTHIVFSHGHNDHTLGLKYLVDEVDLSKVNIISHPDCFIPKYYGEEYIGAPFAYEEMEKISQFAPSKDPVNVTDNLIFLGEIPRDNDFEKSYAIGNLDVDGETKEDYIFDDTALVYKNDDGIFVITGCSHSGICNIVEYAKKITGDNRVLGIIGGFHLFEDDERLAKTVKYFKENNINKLYPCHCVSLKAKAKMLNELNVIEVGVGMELEI